MAIMWLTSLAAASKASRNSAKSCEAGKVHSADECEYRLSLAFFLELPRRRWDSLRLSLLGVGLNRRTSTEPLQDVIWTDDC
jgi:hypothetical protein